MKRLFSYVLILCFAVTCIPLNVFGAENNSDLITYEKPGPFDYYIDGDPMQISDEEFFGVWDNAMQRWSSEPYFRYDDFPDMILVKEAAQAGQYDVAKDELLAYYRSIKDERSVPYTSSPALKMRLQSEALQKNVYAVDFSSGNINGFINVNNEWEQHSLDVTSSFDSSVIGELSVRGFMIMSVDKHNTYAEIYSRESEYAPTLEMVVNGIPMEIKASKDAMVRGGEYGSTNYGSDEIITIQESGQYQNFNSNTKRAVIAFDISNLRKTDKVSSVTLKLWARNASQTGEKELIVYRINNSSFDEDEVCLDEYTDHVLWSCNDQNAWDYIAPRHPAKGKACYYHRGHELENVAKLYSYSKDEVHAFTFIRQHMSLVNHVGYDDYIYNALDMSCQLDNGTLSVYYVLDSEYMTGEILTAMLKTWWQQAFYEVDYFYGIAVNNWGSFATLGVYAFISRFQEFAIFDEWYELTQKENNRLISGFITSDGMSIELPLGYHATLLDTISGPFDVQSATGVPVPYSEYAINEVIYNLVKVFITCTSPGFKGFNIADGMDYNSSFVGDVKKFYYLLFPDEPMFEYVVTGGLSGEMPENSTTNFPVGLRTYMRSSWDKDAYAMAFINSIYGSHEHNDMLSITMFAHGKFLLIDPSYGTVKNANIDGGYMLSAPQHNLVTINNHDHDTRLFAYQEAFETNKLYDFSEMGGQYTSDKVNQKRNILFLKKQKFWIVGDYENPENQETQYSYEQNWHMMPMAYPTFDEDTLEIRSNYIDYNVNLVPVGIENLNAYHVDTYFSPASGALEQNIKTVLQKNATGDTTFSTIILPRGLNEDFDVQCEIIEVQGVEQTLVNSFVAKIKNTLTGDESYYYYYHLNDESKKTKVNLGRFSTDATTMLVETDLNGNVVSTFLMDATILEDNTITDKILFQSKTPVESIAYEKNGQIFDVYSSTITDEQMNDVTMYAPGMLNVRLDEDFIDGKKSGKYLYFGDEPIFIGTEEDEVTGETVTTPDDDQHGQNNYTPAPGGGGGGGGAPAPKPPVEDKPEDTTPEVVLPPEEITVPSNITNELESHWGKDAITSLYKGGIITGDNNGLRLKDSISRAEFTALVVRALGLENAEYKDGFKDVKSNDWYAQYIATAFENGLISGADGMFRPNDTITREEICKIISSAIEVEGELEELDFADKGEISPWAIDSVKIAFSLGIVNGMDNGSFAPKSNALREQAFVMLSRMLSVIK